LIVHRREQWINSMDDPYRYVLMNICAVVLNVAFLSVCQLTFYGTACASSMEACWRRWIRWIPYLRAVANSTSG